MVTSHTLAAIVELVFLPQDSDGEFVRNKGSRMTKNKDINHSCHSQAEEDGEKSDLTYLL